jgi:hypothetical protein
VGSEYLNPSALLPKSSVSCGLSLEDHQFLTKPTSNSIQLKPNSHPHPFSSEFPFNSESHKNNSASSSSSTFKFTFLISFWKKSKSKKMSGNVVCVLSLVVVLSCVVCPVVSRPQINRQYPLRIQPEFDGIDISQYLKNSRLVKLQINCVLFDGPCVSSL